MLTFLATKIILKAVYAITIKCNVAAEHYCITSAHVDEM